MLGFGENMIFIEQNDIDGIKRIITNVKELIDREINIMNSEGYIITSTNAKRIGKYHAGADYLLRNELNQLIIDKDNVSQFEGCINGINLPIALESRGKMVVGISGEKGEVEVFGKIVQAFIEEQLNRLYSAQMAMKNTEMRNAFLASWLLSDKVVDGRELTLSAELFEIDIKAPRVVAVISRHKTVDDKKKKASAISMHSMQTNLNLFSNIEGIILSNSQDAVVADFGYYYLCIFTVERGKKITSIIDKCRDFASEYYDTSISVGVGTAGIGLEGIKNSFGEAKLACTVASRAKDDYIKFYSSVDSDILLSLLPKNYKKLIYNEIFNKINDDEKQEAMQLLASYFENDGSIIGMASQMFIHKNTVQYRLNKLADLINLDVRKTPDMIWLYLMHKLYEGEGLN